MLHHSSEFIKATVPQYYDIQCDTKFSTAGLPRYAVLNLVDLNLDRPVVMLLFLRVQQTVSITVGITQLVLNSVGTAVQIRGRKSSERLGTRTWRTSIPPNHALNTKLPPGKWVNSGVN